MNPKLSTLLPSSTSQSFPAREDCGAIIVLLAILLPVLIGVLALSIDYGLGAISRGQGRDGARLAALAALEEYYHNRELPSDQRLEKALARATEVLGKNVVLATTTSSASIALDDSQSEVMELEPGKYHFQMPTDEVNPCQAGKTPPCFVPLASGEEANAFRIHGNLGGGMRTIFANAAFGVDTLDLNIDITSSVVPRLGCFLIDISGSMVRETHPRFIEDPSHPGSGIDENINEYAYFMNSTSHACKWNRLGNSTVGCDDPASSKLNHITRPPGGNVSPTVHYQNDYENVDLLSDSDYASDPEYAKHHPDPSNFPQFSTTGGTYRVDTFRSGDYFTDPPDPASYVGPEPLTTVFRGLQKAVTRFKERAVSGDQVCMIFYDRDLIWPRIFSLTDDWDYLLKFLDLSGEYDPNAASPNGTTLSLRHGLFPSVNSFTATYRAMLEAERQFVAATDGSSTPHSDFMVTIGDGLANCTTCPDNSPVDSNGDGQVTQCEIFEATSCSSEPANHAPTPESNDEEDCQDGFAPTCAFWDKNGDGWVDHNEVDDMVELFLKVADCGTPGCSDQLGWYETAVQTEITNYATHLFNSKIQLHTMLVGATVEPNTRDVWNNSKGRCMTENEKRLIYAGADYAVEWNWSDCDGTLGFLHKSPFCTFRRPNRDWWEITRKTGGIWAPLRPQKDPLDLYGRTGDGFCGECRNPWGYGEWRMGDPLCRTRTQQIEDYMEKIIETNPYMIVQN